MSDDGETLLEMARANDRDVNDELAATGGHVCEMYFSGAIGYHIHVATGETSPQYLTRTALLQALDEVLFERVYVDETDDVDEARAAVERELHEMCRPLAAEHIADEYESNLRSLQEAQEEIKENDP
jgi:hypothetical protein